MHGSDILGADLFQIFLRTRQWDDITVYNPQQGTYTISKAFAHRHRSLARLTKKSVHVKNLSNPTVIYMPP
jgi:hypothetical protein